MARHGVGEGLLGITQAARVALPPDRELPVGGSGPQHVVGPVVLVPGPGRLPELLHERLHGVHIVGHDDPASVVLGGETAEQALTASLVDALDALEVQYGSVDVADWLQPVAHINWSPIGVGSVPDTIWMNSSSGPIMPEVLVICRFARSRCGWLASPG